MVQESRNIGIRHLHEIFFSLNLSLALTTFVLYGFGRWFNWDFSFAVPGFLRGSILRGVGPEEFPYNVMTVRWFLFPALAICLWFSLRLFNRLRFTVVALRSVAGILAIVAAPVWWLTYFDGAYAFRTAGLYEMLIALACLTLYLRRNWPLPIWCSLMLLLAHYAFWLWQFRGYIQGYWGQLGAFFNYDLQERSWLLRSLAVLRTVVEYGWSDLVAVTALMPVVGLLSGFVWALYMSKEQPPTSGSP
jgi:hypothetical protein